MLSSGNPTHSRQPSSGSEWRYVRHMQTPKAIKQLSSAMDLVQGFIIREMRFGPAHMNIPRFCYYALGRV